MNNIRLHGNHGIKEKQFKTKLKKIIGVEIQEEVYKVAKKSIKLNKLENKFDVIYIDPPYNTGHEDFMYNDKYIDAANEFRHST